MSSSSLQSNTVLVALRLHKIGNSKKDDAISDEVAKEHRAQAGAGRYSKHLFDPEALRPFSKLYRQIRAEHERLTLPFERGMRLLPAKAVAEHTEKMAAFETQIEAMATVFCERYDAHLARAREMLGDLFEESLYPSREDVFDEFAMECTILPMPGKEVLADYITPEMREGLEQEVARRYERLENEARNDLARRILEPLRRMVDRLSADEGSRRINATLVTNLQDIVGLIPALNITHDPTLESIRRDITENLNVTADQLRHDEEARRTALENAQRISRRFGPAVLPTTTETSVPAPESQRRIAV